MSLSGPQPKPATDANGMPRRRPCNGRVSSTADPSPLIPGSAVDLSGATDFPERAHPAPRDPKPARVRAHSRFAQDYLRLYNIACPRRAAISRQTRSVLLNAFELNAFESGSAP